MNTICPDCNASFNVTEQQLSIASGKVRCGSCLHIFNAIEHIDEEIVPPVLTSDKQSSEGKIKNISAEEDEAWALKLIGDPEPEPDDPDLEQGSPILGQGEPLQANTPRSANVSSQPASNAIQTELTTAPAPNSGPSNLGSEDFSDGFDALQDFDEDTPINFFGSKEDAALLAGDEASTDHWAEEMLKELEQEPDPETTSSEANITGALDELGFSSKSDPISFNETEFSFSGNSLSEEPLTEDPMSDDPLGLGSLENDVEYEHEFEQEQLNEGFIDPQILISNLSIDPLEMSLEKGRDRHFKRTATHLLSVLLATTLLAGQYAYFQFDRLARTEQLRPYYAQLCATIQCQLPTLQDTKQIRGSNLIIRSHPSYLNALVVDAIISNRAAYPQSFPSLELTFSDINDVIVATRVFTPVEYLKGELLNLAAMPARAPIHITLEIIDPGATAVNYALQFHPFSPSS